MDPSSANLRAPAVEMTDQSHSMPSVEEVRTEAVLKHGASNPHSGKSRRRMLLIGIIVASLVLIIAFSVAISKSVSSKRNKGLYSWAEDGDIDDEDESLQNFRSKSRLQEVKDFLKVKISDEDLLNDNSSPQYKAARWIADQDYMEVDIPEDPEDYTNGYEFVQRYIMALFYFAMDGAQWRYKAYFMSDYDVCEWNYEFFADEAPPGSDNVDWMYGIQCNDEGAIDTIFITSNGLQGELPDELGDLLDLDHLSLFDNMISGGIPPRMKYLADLDFLAIESNDLSGPLPDWIGDNYWTSLQYLALGDNELTGEIPNLAGLVYLKELALDNNQFEGSVDPFNDLPFIESLFLNENRFTGPFNDDTWGDLENLSILDLSSNELVGLVPEWVYYLDSVDLSDNYLGGQTDTDVGTPLPEYLGDDSEIVFLSLYGNNLKGPIPDSIGSLTTLTHLDLSDNYLTGEIPEIDYLTELRVLYLTDNEFSPQVFPDVYYSESLEELGLGDARLTGTIPAWIGDTLTELVVLDLRDNDLTGTIPENLGDLEWIEIIVLNYNELTGEIPDFSYATELSVLYVDNNGSDEGDELWGSLASVCDAEPEGLYGLVADCDVDCECCSACCAADAENCNEWDEDIRMSNEMERDAYLFSEDLIFNQAMTE